MTVVSEKDRASLKIYEIHVEMADRVSQRREGANKLFVATLSAMLVLLAAALMFGSESGGFSVKIAVPVMALTGFFLAVSWYITIRSYRQLNTGKFHALQELEKSLPFAFYTVEWEKLQEGTDWRIYWKLTVVETFLPCIFSVLFIAIGAITLAC